MWVRKHQKINQRRRLPWKIILPSLLVIGLIILLKNVHLLTVKQETVSLQNVGCLDQSTAEQLANFKGQGFLLLNSSSVENAIKLKYRCIDAIKVAKHWPSSVDVSIIGRTPVLKFIPAIQASPPAELSVDSPIFKQLEQSSDSASISAQITPLITTTDYLNDIQPQGGALLSDDNGLLYAQDSGTNVPPVILLDPGIELGYRIDPSQIQEILQIIKKFTELSLPIHSLTVKESTAVVKSDNPVYLLFTLNPDISRELASLQLILRQNTIDSKSIESIDFRFDRPVVTNSPKKS